MSRLSAEQRAFYEAFGFLVFRRLFSADEMDAITREAEAVLAEGLGGQPFTGQTRHMVLGFVEQRPRLADLVEDDRVYEPGFLAGGGPRRQGMVRQLVAWGFR